MKLLTKHSIFDCRARHPHQLGPHRRLLGDEFGEIRRRAGLRDRAEFQQIRLRFWWREPLVDHRIELRDAERGRPRIVPLTSRRSTADEMSRVAPAIRLLPIDAQCKLAMVGERLTWF